MAKDCSKYTTIVVLLSTICIFAGCAGVSVQSPSVPEEQERQPRYHGSISNATQHTAFEVGEAVEPCLSPDGRTIVFASNHHGPTFDIFTKEIGGSTVTQITTNKYDDRQPALSPDGSVLAFVSNRDGNWNIYIRPMQPGGKEVRLTDDKSDDIHPSWSPDGTRLVYSTFNRRKGAWQLWIMEFGSSGFKRRSLGVEGLFPEWQPAQNGETILFQRPRGRSPHLYTLWTVRSDGKRLVEVLESARWAVVSPSWSRNGEWIVFSSALPQDSGERNAGNLWIIRHDGKFLTKIGNGSLPQWDAACGPDGRVFFVMPRAEAKNIWSIAPDFRGLPSRNAPAPKPEDKSDDGEKSPAAKET